MITSTLTYIVVFLIGLCVGMIIQSRRVRNRLRIKAEDQTAEVIGNGDFVYVLKSDDYYKKVLRSNCEISI